MKSISHISESLSIYESIQEQDVDKAYKYIIDYIQKYIGKLYPLPGIDEIQKTGSSTILYGRRYLIGKNHNQSFRLNWEKNDRSLQLQSMDYFPDITDQPTLTFIFGSISIVKILPVVVEFLKKPTSNFKIEKYIDVNNANLYNTQSTIQEAFRLGSRTRAAMRDAGYLRQQDDNNDDEDNSDDDVVTTPQRPISNSKKPKIEKSPKEENVNQDQSEIDLYKALRGSPNDVYKDLRYYIDLIISGESNSLIISGQPGWGKSMSIETQFHEHGLKKDVHYVIYKGKVSVIMTYVALYENNGKIVVFDDADNVFKDDDGVNILKGALDSYKEREISYKTASPLLKDSNGNRIPTTFMFTGRSIFATNTPIKDIDSALKSRSYIVDMNFTIKQQMQIITENMPNIAKKYTWGSNITDSMRKEVLDLLHDAIKHIPNIVLDFRVVENILRLRVSNIPSWKEMALRQLSISLVQ